MKYRDAQNEQKFQHLERVLSAMTWSTSSASRRGQSRFPGGAGSRVWVIPNPHLAGRAHRLLRVRMPLGSKLQPLAPVCFQIRLRHLVLPVPGQASAIRPLYLCEILSERPYEGSEDHVHISSVAFPRRCFCNLFRPEWNSRAAAEGSSSRLTHCHHSTYLHFWIDWLRRRQQG